MLSRKIDKKRLWISIAIVGLMLVVSFINIGIDRRHAYDLENQTRIFDSLLDLSFLDKYATENNQNDQRRMITVIYNEETYTVSAFVFESKEGAWTFAKEISGSNYQKLNEELGRNHFHYSQVKSFLGLFSSRKSMIISDNKILLIEGSGSAKDYAAFVDFVMRHLPQKVDFTK